MFTKVLILLLLAIMVISLFAGLFFLVKDRGGSDRLFKALTARVSIWIVLFLLLVVGLYTGLITPSESLRPTNAPATAR